MLLLPSITGVPVMPISGLRSAVPTSPLETVETAVILRGARVALGPEEAVSLDIEISNGKNSIKLSPVSVNVNDGALEII